jgi:hypothetical protein
MKTLAYLFVLALAPALATAEEAWRWTDGDGTIHYTNRRESAPADATAVTTRIVVEAAALPGGDPDLVLQDGMVMDAHETRPEVAPPRKRPPYRIYSENRRRFGCFASGILFSGGWSHPDDITVEGNCLPYLLGPEAWLNAARAELALRQNGIDWREVVPMYLAERRWEAEQERLTSISDTE